MQPNNTLPPFDQGIIQMKMYWILFVVLTVAASAHPAIEAQQTPEKAAQQSSRILAIAGRFSQM
jgi:hypothetical protein